MERKCWWGKTIILRTSHIKFQYWLEQCSEYVTFNSAYTFVLLLQLHCIGGTFRFAPRENDDDGSQAAEPPQKKRRRQTSKTLRDLPQKKDDDARQICRKNNLYYQSWLQQCPKKRKHKFHLLNFATSFATELDHFYSGLYANEQNSMQVKRLPSGPVVFLL